MSHQFDEAVVDGEPWSFRVSSGRFLPSSFPPSATYMSILIVGSVQPASSLPGKGPAMLCYRSEDHDFGGISDMAVICLGKLRGNLAVGVRFEKFDTCRDTICTVQYCHLMRVLSRASLLHWPLVMQMLRQLALPVAENRYTA